ncbi:hypothetical protein [Endozoicomonas atrinae]|uniref:hypothetical protein n=1 Tax=Endozoicomonas atrinae TaxID=1333660 RepID=UPI0008256DB4|nr:hypothetical protein [Endozoicomonas atrinae]
MQTVPGELTRLDNNLLSLKKDFEKCPEDGVGTRIIKFMNRNVFKVKEYKELCTSCRQISSYVVKETGNSYAKSILNRTVVSVENYEDILARVRTQLSSSGDPFFTDTWGDDAAEEAPVTEAIDTPKPPSMTRKKNTTRTTTGT